ncbi:acyltransferase [Pseudorhodoferax sp. Leaf267]|uniref:acyltransferase family protein n=1 Tax=Pseudorhodoferax sp. Leaf267 TaxID=1736316 RepID=UPI0009E99764|nr:acyltransferase [Pseudorhodoferax sp. Leaf267]
MKSSNNFDVVRLLAALLVVYGHAYPLTGSVSPFFAGNSVQSIGVKIFFVVSGYLIIGSWQRDPSIGRFFQRRALRIMPGLCVVIVLSAFILGPLVSVLPMSEYFESPRLWTYVMNNFAFRPQYDLPGVFGSNPYPVAVNGSLWSLPAEVAMYFIGPMVCVLGGLLFRSARWGVFLGSFLLMGLSIWFVRIAPPSAHPVFYGTSLLSFLDVAPYFLIGALYTLFKWDLKVSPLLAAAMWMSLSLVQFPGVSAELALYAVLPYTVLALGLQHTNFSSRLHQFGDVSYGVYLYSFPLQQLFAYVFPLGHASPWINTALTLPALLILATMSWRLVERPLLKFKIAPAIT